MNIWMLCWSAGRHSFAGFSRRPPASATAGPWTTSTSGKHVRVCAAVMATVPVDLSVSVMKDIMVGMAILSSITPAMVWCAAEQTSAGFVFLRWWLLFVQQRPAQFHKRQLRVWFGVPGELEFDSGWRGRQRMWSAFSSCSWGFTVL